MIFFIVLVQSIQQVRVENIVTHLIIPKLKIVNMQKIITKSLSAIQRTPMNSTLNRHRPRVPPVLTADDQFQFSCSLQDFVTLTSKKCIEVSLNADIIHEHRHKISLKLVAYANCILLSSRSLRKMRHATSDKKRGQ